MIDSTTPSNSDDEGSLDDEPPPNTLVVGNAVDASMDWKRVRTDAAIATCQAHHELG